LDNQNISIKRDAWHLPFISTTRKQTMSIVIHTFTAGDYSAQVFDDAMVEIRYQGLLIDRPGPWGDCDGAIAWADLIVQKFAVDGHLRPAPSSLG